MTIIVSPAATLHFSPLCRRPWTPVKWLKPKPKQSLGVKTPSSRREHMTCTSHMINTTRPLDSGCLDTMRYVPQDYPEQWISVCLSVCMSVCLSVCLSVCPSHISRTLIPSTSQVSGTSSHTTALDSAANSTSRGPSNRPFPDGHCTSSKQAWNSISIELFICSIGNLEPFVI